jgi:hypothetical protein
MKSQSCVQALAGLRSSRAGSLGAAGMINGLNNAGWNMAAMRRLQTHAMAREVSAILRIFLRRAPAEVVRACPVNVR